MTSIRAKTPFELCAKQNKQRDHLFKIGIKKRKGEKNWFSICFFRNKTKLRSVITQPKYVSCLTICIDLITKVKSLRKLNLFKHTLSFAFSKKYRIYTSHFFTSKNSFAKCGMRSANSNPDTRFILCIEIRLTFLWFCIFDLFCFLKYCVLLLAPKCHLGLDNFYFFRWT